MSVKLSEVSFLQTGKGKDLVFLHGYLSSKEAFTAQINYFSKFFRVTAIDFVGVGGSKPLVEPYSVEDYAVWTEEVLRLLGVEKPHVVAHSFGCRVAVKMAARSPDCFDKILHLENADVQEFDGSYVDYNLALLLKKIEQQELAAKDLEEIEPLR